MVVELEQLGGGIKKTVNVSKEESGRDCKERRSV
jgi:hypothetical protein